MEMSGLGVELHPNGGQADEEVDEVMGTVSEPGERLRSWIRPFAFVVLAMAMATQVLSQGRATTASWRCSKT